MNIVAKSDFNFQGFSFNTVSEAGAVYFTSTDLAKALGYKKTDAISQIYARNADEFTDSMSMTLNMKVNGINNSLRNKAVRIYSLRGAHLIAMFATTDKAKEFRRWVLDILDREVAAGAVPAKFDFQMHVHNANVACMHMDVIRQAWNEQLYSGLKKLGSPLAVELHDRIGDAGAILYGIRGALERASGLKGLQCK